MEERIGLEIVPCTECGNVFGILPNYHQNLKQVGKVFFCPNGHSLTYKNSENKQLKDKLEEATTQLTLNGVRIDQQDKTISNQKGQITKLKKQIT